MVFSSLTFLLYFLPVTLLLYFLRPKRSWRNGVLLAASLLFYSWGEPVFVLMMLFSTLANYLCALGIERARTRSARRGFMALGVVISAAALFYFKYAAFLINSVGALFGADWNVAARTLPVGISFYTFQIITYTVDVYRDRTRVQRSFPLLLLYVSCFPQLIAGPIVQYGDVEDRLDARSESTDGFTEGMRRFALGLGKKVLLANVCGAALEQLNLGGTGSMSFCGAWFAAFLYALQLYFDFSAYSDMAIGLGRVFGFEYRENFDYPYVSRSVSEFWRRWHISLGSFFREYVYIPLGGNRRGNLMTARNLLIVWALTGLWHGASWNFVLWGLYYGALLMLERFVLADVLRRTPKLLGQAVTFILVLIGWVLFYYTDLAQCGVHLAAMFGFGSGFTDATTLAVFRKYSVFPLIAFVCAMPVVPALRRMGGEMRRETPLHIAGMVLASVVLVVSMLFLIGQSYNPFIYFRF